MDFLAHWRPIADSRFYLSSSRWLDNSIVLLKMLRAKKGKSNATMEQRVGDNLSGFNLPHHQRPFDNVSTYRYHDMSHRTQEEFPRHEAWYDDNFYGDYGDHPNVGQAYHGAYYGNQQGHKALDKIKWKRTVVQIFPIHYKYFGWILVSFLLTDFEDAACFIAVAGLSLPAVAVTSPVPKLSGNVLVAIYFRSFVSASVVRLSRPNICGLVAAGFLDSQARDNPVLCSVYLYYKGLCYFCFVWLSSGVVLIAHRFSGLSEF
ncbi:hypothetical protein M9H77_30838 [Catharanthus roseus]|uniref:Uncharacterized protein n=1 Tax=Catharanthus roseus TaxID=4058 RepID=A0ACB9ZYS5_CATRO|nr:hypothetical protein M9H77_30838 [Catharanthus roseus]